jgi:hypothetical protein
MKELKVLCLLFLINLFQTSSAQNINELLDSANLEFKQEHYKTALTLYKRIDFFSDRIDFKWNMLKAAYLSKNFDDSYLLSKNMLGDAIFKDSLVLLDYFAVSALNTEKYDVLLNEDYYGFADYESFYPKYKQYCLLAYFRQKKWSEASELIQSLKAAKGLNTSKSDSLTFILYELIKIEPEKIANKSLLIPGLGQVYLGDYKNGTHAFLLNSGLIGGLICTAIIHAPVDALLFWFTPLSHYYLGNANAALELSNKKIERLKMEFEMVLMRP